MNLEAIERIRQLYEQVLLDHWETRYRAYTRGYETDEEFLDGYELSDLQDAPRRVQQASEFYQLHVQQKDWGTVQVFALPTEDGDTYAVYVTTDGDDGWIEVYDTQGELVGAGRTYIELIAWGDINIIRSLVETRDFPPELDERQEMTLWGKPLDLDTEEDESDIEEDDSALATAEEMIAIVTDFFSQDEWPFSEGEIPEIIHTTYQGDSGRWNCYARVREAAQQIVFYSICPIYVPDLKRLVMAEFLTRANYGLIMGNFEMDFNDGEIRYKTSIDVERIPLDQPWNMTMIKQIVYANVLTMDKYLPGILRVVASDDTPAEVIAEIEEG